MTAIFKRELRSYFHGMLGYVLTAFLLASSGIYFLALNLGYGLTGYTARFSCCCSTSRC